MRHILVTHSESVARRALQIASQHPELNIDTDFVRHGVCGAELLRSEGIDERYARVCERHTGAGLTLDDIVSQNLPLPHHDLQPETIEEKLICYADKFYSKSHLSREKTIEQAEKSLAKFGGETLARFRAMKDIFEPEK